MTKAVIYRSFTVVFPLSALAWLHARGLHSDPRGQKKRLHKKYIRICLSPEDAETIVGLYNRAHGKEG